MATSRVQNDYADQLWIRVTGTEDRRDLHIFCAYPQETASKSVRDAAYIALEAAAVAFAAKGDVVLLGDLNAKLLIARGSVEERYIGVCGQQGTRTGNGAFLFGMMRRIGLVNLLGRSRPPQKVREVSDSDYWWTRRDKVSGVKHTIDFVLATESSGPEQRPGSTTPTSARITTWSVLRCPVPVRWCVAEGVRPPGKGSEWMQ